MSSAGIIASHYVASGGGGNPYSTEVLADSPALYWKFAETTGTSAADSSGNSKPGTIGGSPTLGATTVMPAGSGSFTLDATSKRVVVVPFSAINVTSFSAEAWVNLSNVTSYHNIFNRDGSNVQRGWNLYVTNGKLNGYDGASDHISTGSSMSTGTAYYVAVTCDGTTVKLYLNGSLDFSFSVAAGWGTNATGGSSFNNFTVGASEAGSSSGTFALPLTGNIDHVAFYPSALSSTRIAAHYAAASVGP